MKNSWNPKDYYCNFVCEKGCKQKDKFIWESESAFDAVFDMQEFIKECEKTCPNLDIRETFEVPAKI